MDYIYKDYKPYTSFDELIVAVFILQQVAAINLAVMLISICHLAKQLFLVFLYDLYNKANNDL